MIGEENAMMTVLMHRRRTGQKVWTSPIPGLAIASALALVGGVLLLIAS
jgi:hypothetical protein